MFGVEEALLRASQERTDESWERVDRLARAEVQKGIGDAEDLRRLITLALERTGFEPSEGPWTIALLREALIALDRSEALQAHFSCVGGALHSINRQGQIIAVSQGWLDLLGGYERDSVVGRLSTEFLTAESQDKAKVVLPKFWRAGIINDCPYDMVKADGSVIPVLFDAICARDESNRPTNSICVVRKRYHPTFCNFLIDNIPKNGMITPSSLPLRWSATCQPSNNARKPWKRCRSDTPASEPTALKPTAA